MIGATIPPTSPEHYALAAAVQQVIEAMLETVPPEDLGEAITRLMSWHADQMLRATLAGIAEGIDGQAAQITSTRWPLFFQRRGWVAGMKAAATILRAKAASIPHTAPPLPGNGFQP